MVTIVGVQFQKNGKEYDFDANQFDLKPGDYVIADTQRGIDLGQISAGLREVEDSTIQNPLKKIVRIATEQDLQHGTEIRVREKEAYEICQKKISEHQLDMKLVSVEYAFDGSKAIFYFTANGRVDFRSLVKDLASVFKMRIELRQIGVRDEARMLGGLGPCGRPICCGSFLSEFQPVSIKMAKEQNLSLNPTKISGVCGRLMCCLKYEQEHYEQTRRRMPKIGKEVNTPDGKGTVTDLNIVKESLFVRITNGDTNEIKEYSLEDIEQICGTVQNQIQNTPAENQPEQCEDMPVPDSTDDTERIEQAEKPKPHKTAKNNKKPSAKVKEGKKNELNSQPPKEQHQLGKPVMRENPNRNQASKQNTSPKDSEKPEQSKTSWAEAVQKAMDSFNKTDS